MKRERQPQSNPFLWYIDNLKEKFSKITFLDPKLLLTENRYDVSLRVDFLTEVIRDKQEANKTKYFKFISDKDKGIGRDAEKAVKDFEDLFQSIKNNGILNPIFVGKYTHKKIKTRYIVSEEKKWIVMENDSGFQLMDGAHRLAVAIFLKLHKIPVKIISPVGFEIPNYTEYINSKEKEYL
jgi:hypothetical protein